MIFGRTFEEEQAIEQKWRERHLNKWVKKFAWFPKQLSDGRLIWLATFYLKHHLYRSDNTGEIKLHDCSGSTTLTLGSNDVLAEEE